MLYNGFLFFIILFLFLYNGFIWNTKEFGFYSLDDEKPLNRLRRGKVLSNIFTTELNWQYCGAEIPKVMGL